MQMQLGSRGGRPFTGRRPAHAAVRPAAAVSSRAAWQRHGRDASLACRAQMQMREVRWGIKAGCHHRPAALFKGPPQGGAVVDEDSSAEQDHDVPAALLRAGHREAHQQGGPHGGAG